MRGLRNLLIFAAVLLVGGALIWLAVQLTTPSRPSQPDQPQQPVVLWTGIEPPLALDSAAERGAERARAWQTDAILVRVEATWRPGPERLHVEIPPVAWSLYYYSPSARRLASAVVDAAQTFWVPPVPALVPPQELAPFPPPHECRTAWLTFRGAEGEEFIRAHPDATVSMVLRMQEGRPVWTVLAASGEHHLKVSVDAETGLALP
jgi:hypothetical protein